MVVQGAHHVQDMAKELVTDGKTAKPVRGLKKPGTKETVEAPLHIDDEFKVVPLKA